MHVSIRGKGHKFANVDGEKIALNGKQNAQCWSEKNTLFPDQNGQNLFAPFQTKITHSISEYSKKRFRSAYEETERSEAPQSSQTNLINNIVMG